MMKLLVYIALCWWAASACEYGEPVCEWKSTDIIWQCPEGHYRKLRASWGRDAGDNMTCVDGVPYQYLQNLNCPGDDQKAAEAVADWCDSHVNGDGQCEVHARTRLLRVGEEKYDPCPETFKYLRVCSSCTPGGETFNMLMATDPMLDNVYKKSWSSEYLALIVDIQNQMNNALVSSPGYLGAKVIRLRAITGKLGRTVLRMQITMAEGSGNKEIALASKIMYKMSFTHSGKELKQVQSPELEMRSGSRVYYTTECSVYNDLQVCLNGSSCSVVSGSPECTTGEQQDVNIPAE